MIKLNAICPMSDKKVNKWISRFNAGFTFLLLSVFFLTNCYAIIVFLAVDFFIRAIDQGIFSPLAFLSRQLLKVLPFEEKKINMGPKIFAARIGFFFCLMVLFFTAISLPLTGLVFASVFALFSFLEAFFGFCMACYIYPLLYKVLYHLEFRD